MSYTIGIDLGGTNIKGGVCDHRGAVLVHDSVETQADRGFEHVLGRMAALVTSLREQARLRPEDVLGVGIGAPGPLSHTEGVIIRAPNLPGWINVPLRDRLASATGFRTVLENDANAAAYGEFFAGAGAGVSSLLMLTLGTGIGGGVILDRQLWRGRDDSAGEVGHTVIVPAGRPCPCGQLGCLERYASANAVAERLVEAVQAGESSVLESAVRAGRSFDAREVLAAADQGDSLAIRIWDETCYYLALACLNIEHILSPELIVLAGGLIHAGDKLLDPLQRHYQSLRWNIATHPPRIAFARLGDQAGIIGTAALVRT